jgi:hypothetical protein
LGWAIGASGWARSAAAARLEQELVTLLDDPEHRLAAALALLLGGSTDGATHAAAVIRRTGAMGQQALRSAYERAVAVVHERDLTLGNLHRWVANAQTMARASSPRDPPPWAVELLAASLRGLEADAGPHSLTRPVLRYRLLAEARAGSAEAVSTLGFMGERGSLMALAAEGGAVGEQAARTLR